MSTDAETPKQGRELTGWHVLAMFVGMFGIIIGVNVFMAWKRDLDLPRHGGLVELRRQPDLRHPPRRAGGAGLGRIGRRWRATR
jgi:hypothetical protein